MTFKMFAAAAVVVFSMACNPFSSSNTTGADVFTWTVNGQSFRAAEKGMIAFRRAGNSYVDLVGSDCQSSSVLLGFVGGVAVGTYTVGSPRIDVGYVLNGVQWGANARGGSGSVTVLSVSGSRVVGTFAVEMVPPANNPSAGTRSVQGAFDLGFSTRTVCG
jgi:hypothetical protein